MKRSKSLLASALVALTLLGGMATTASALSYQEWRRVQLDRIQEARQRGEISQQEANRYKWRINHMNNNAAFNRNWNRQYGTWYNNYWKDHPDAWRWQNNTNSRWNRNYNNDNLQDLRDFFSNFQ